MSLMDEKVPGAPSGLNPIQAVLATLAKMKAQSAQAQAASAGAAPGGPASPAIVGGMPSLQRPPGPQLPGATGSGPGMSSFPNPSGGIMPGAGGLGPSSYPSPMERPMPQPAQGGQEFNTKAARNSAAAAGAINSLTQGIVAYKQRQWQQRKQVAQAFMSQYIALQQSDDPKIQEQAKQMLADKKNQKLLEKAQKDPTSPEYQGLTQAQKEAVHFIQGQQEQQAKMQQIQAQMAAAQAEAARAKAGQAKDEALTPKTPEERAVAMGTAPSADVKTQTEAEIKRAQIMAGMMTRGQPILDKASGKWIVPFYTKDGKLDHYETLQGTPASQTDTHKESTQTLNADGTITTDTTTSKIAPGAHKSGQPATPSGVPMSKASDYMKRLMIDNAAWQWATRGQMPPGKTYQSVVYARMMQMGMTPGMKPTADMLRRASMATMILSPENGQSQSILDRTIAGIEANQDALKPFSNRVVNSIDQFGKVLPPELSTIAANLQSIYTVAAGLHGFRSIKAPEEFKKLYGSISMRPDSLLANLRELKMFAETVAASQQQGIGGNTGAMSGPVAPGAPASGGKPKGTGTKEDPIVIDSSEIK